MGANSKIEWTDHTFNPWIGCTKVSPGCKNCYAERDMDHRFGRVQWGLQGQRVRTSEAYWRKPLAWNQQPWERCLECGWRGAARERFFYCPQCSGDQVVPARARVFCASLADVFEDNDQLLNWRHDLFSLIRQTPNLDWLLLTKRAGIARLFFRLRSDLLFPNVWLGVSVENQATADERIPALLKVPAAVRFLSCEPLIGAVELPEQWSWFNSEAWANNAPPHISLGNGLEPDHSIDWVIAGGESGPKARPTHPKWVRDLRDQCIAAGVPFHFKQWGEWAEVRPGYDGVEGISRPEWGFFEDGEFVKGTGTPSPSKRSAMVRVGRKAAGRLLDGREWDEFPQGANNG